MSYFTTSQKLRDISACAGAARRSPNDTTAITHRRGLWNPGQGHINFAEEYHLHIAGTHTGSADQRVDATAGPARTASWP